LISEWLSDHGSLRNCVVDVDSITGAMKDVFESRKKELGDYLEAFTLHPEQQGILVYMNGKVCRLDFLLRKEAFTQIFPKLIKSYAMDALLEEQKSRKAHGRVEPAAFLAGTKETIVLDRCWFTKNTRFTWPFSGSNRMSGKFPWPGFTAAASFTLGDKK
jgi:hypothetical protein